MEGGRMKVKFGFFIILLALVSFISFGCNKSSNESYNDQTATKSEEKQSTTDKIKTEVGDAAITASVKTKLMTDENVAARKIDVTTENGIVTLRGKVATETEAERAIELAKTADGVRLVHSYLKTDATSTSDLDTDQNKTDDLKDKTAEYGEKTKDTLNDIGNKLEKGIDEAGDVGSDAAITAQIKWKLAKDKLVQASDIEVDTKDRHVTLNGTVSTTQEAQRAVQLAKSVDNVISVDSNLKIR
jgi:hyperosmotically inducible periplasmic protein